MSRIFTVEELMPLTLHELHALYRECSELSRAASREADLALQNLHVIATAIRLKQSVPKPPGF